jgi:hypothetical protein
MRQFYPTLCAGAWSELGVGYRVGGMAVGNPACDGSRVLSPTGWHNALGRGRDGLSARSPRAATEQRRTACGLVNVSSDLRDRLRARGIDPGQAGVAAAGGRLGNATFGAMADEVHQVIRPAIGEAFTEGAEWIGVPQVLDALADLPESSGAQWFQSIGVDMAELRRIAGKTQRRVDTRRRPPGCRAQYRCGTINRVVRLSDGEHNVHVIGVNWPHHVFVSKDFKVVGAL